MLQHFGKKSSVYYKIFYPILSGSITYFLLLMAFNRIGELEESYFRTEWVVCIIISYFWNFSVLWSASFIGKKIAILSNIYEQIAYHSLGVLLSSILSIGTVLSVYFYYLIGYTRFENFTTEMYVFQGLFIFQTLLFECAWWGNRLIELKNKSIREEEKKRTAYISKEMRLFAEDANLPLLYETLETLIGLAYKDADKAEEYAEKLAKVYRNTINNRKEEFVSVEDAIKNVKSVVELLSDARSGGISASYKLPSDLSSSLVLPPVLLTRLIVAIANDNIASNLQPLDISITIEEDALLVVAHSFNPKLDRPKALPEVMDSLEETFRLYTKIPVLSIKKGKEYIIKLPAFQVENKAWKSDKKAEITTQDQSIFKRTTS
ncbi:histidine kinase [Flammeovirga kamogawensis]|uniref:Histidine kinase n=1 Tax=Flammeovirga kamogawensis TaxID=373891 RepID=A0ABX8H0Z9_9BACT|nr:histidine kinase [Flammeovirga kamogawensis]MBB6463285.1 hypothetical protein [Flammeovirga kamogawensis]QWG09565.1 histidine kinase [Flammeovirga kamogawensis]TRX65079.1 hypothetical protein EO216_21335 [Flammeovirga kamogawensis]